MELVDGIRDRRSVRRFQNRKIDREDIGKIVEVARFAPSWKNTQISKYIFVDDAEKKQQLASEKCMYGFKYNIKTIENAPAVVILIYEEGKSGFEKDGSFSTPKEDRWQMFDAGIAAQTFCLVAYDNGLGTVIMGYFDEEEIKKVIEIPAGFQIGAIIPIGYPEGETKAPARKSADELVTYI